MMEQMEMASLESGRAERERVERERSALEVKVSELRGVFVPYRRVALIQKDIATLHRRDNGTSEGGVMTLFGDARSGKTKILRDYYRQYPTVIKGRVNHEGDHADLIEVALLRVPDTSIKNFLERLLSTLSNVTTAQVKGQGARRFDIQENIIAIANIVGLRLILLEEAHQGIDNKSDSNAKALAGVLKDLTNESRFSMVISGTFEARRLLDASTELAGRVHYEHELHPLKWNDPEDRRMFLDVLHQLDEHLRARVFGQLSGLTNEAIAKPLLQASLGHIGHAATLLEVGALGAVDDFLAGRCSTLTVGHIAAAFTRSPLRRLNPHLFTLERGGVGEPLDNPVTQLRGRTHRTNRDAAFKA